MAPTREKIATMSADEFAHVLHYGYYESGIDSLREIVSARDARIIAEAKAETLSGFRWVYVLGEGKYGDDVNRWELWTQEGKNAATVFLTGTWYVWDEDGVGGENSRAESIDSAKWLAYCAALGWGKHGYGPLLPEKGSGVARAEIGTESA